LAHPNLDSIVAGIWVLGALAMWYFLHRKWYRDDALEVRRNPALPYNADIWNETKKLAVAKRPKRIRFLIFHAAFWPVALVAHTTIFTFKWVFKGLSFVLGKAWYFLTYIPQSILSQEKEKALDRVDREHRTGRGECDMEARDGRVRSLLDRSTLPPRPVRAGITCNKCGQVVTGPKHFCQGGAPAPKKPLCTQCPKCGKMVPFSEKHNCNGNVFRDAPNVISYREEDDDDIVYDDEDDY
jgi:hypothetical protein